MPFVIDASVTASWAFADEDETAAKAARSRLQDDTATTPSLWWFEIRNTLIVNERRRRLSEDVTTAFLQLLAALPIQIDRSAEGAAVISLARRHNLTVYDAAYLELALRRREPLATLDKKLAAAAVAENVALIGAP